MALAEALQELEESKQKTIFEDSAHGPLFRVQSAAPLRFAARIFSSLPKISLNSLVLLSLLAVADVSVVWWSGWTSQIRIAM